MTVSEHVKVCLFVSATVLLAVGIGFFPNMESSLSWEWAGASAGAFVGGFILNTYFAKHREGISGDEPLDTLRGPYATMAMMVLWTPIVLGASAIFLLTWLQVPPQKVGWIVVVVSALVGRHLASLRAFRKQ